jgi:ferredoxin-nitrite reductase
MNTLAPIQEIAGEKLSDEQTAYLDGLFAGMKNRGFSFNDMAPAPVSAERADMRDMIPEERIKRELHPLDAYGSIVENARTNQAPDKEEIFRFKWNGLFWLTPNKDAFMSRLRIPGGVMKSHQLRELAKIARNLTSGYVQITTRANFQLRTIQPKNAPEFLHRLQTVGLSSRGSGADNLRNITASPTAGIDPHELIDVAPYCAELAQLIVNSREFYNLPRKFNIAFDGAGLVGTVEDTNDIGARAVKIVENDEGVKPGVYFRIALGGVTGHKKFANDAGILVSPERLIDVIVAIVRIYIDHGDRTNRKRARMFYLLEDWGMEKYIAEIEKHLGFPLQKLPLDEAGRSPLEERRGLPDAPHSHIGSFPQRQSGLNYVGVGLTAGQITPKQMQRLADLADNYGTGDIRLTVWQNLIVPNIPDAYVATFQKAVRKMGLFDKQSHIRSGLIACTGNRYCKFAAADTKGTAVMLGDYLDKRVPLDQPVNIHITGCPHSCAQHYIGDIGLLGAKVKVGGGSVEGYHVFVGGGFGSNRAVGRQVFKGITVPDLKTTLEKMLQGYLRNRSEGEAFQTFCNRNDLNTLQAIFSNEE